MYAIVLTEEQRSLLLALIRAEMAATAIQEELEKLEELEELVD